MTGDFGAIFGILDFFIAIIAVIIGYFIIKAAVKNGMKAALSDRRFLNGVVQDVLRELISLENDDKPNESISNTRRSRNTFTLKD